MRALNVQPVEKVSYQSDRLKVFKVFATIQGEGPFVGEPCVFLRLSGCNLQCPMCDTDYTSTWVEVEPRLIMTMIWEEHKKVPRSKLVVITGGEPLRQNVTDLMGMLLGNDFVVQIETNGTLFPPELSDWIETNKVHVVCSPKTPQINRDLRPYVGTLKYVLTAGEIDPVDGLPTSVLGMSAPPARPWANFRGEIYVQACDDIDATKNAANVAACIDVAKQFGYRLGAQMHKIWGVE